MASIFRAPQENPNDKTVLVSEWVKREGEPVESGETVCILETTKSTFEFQATDSGFFRHLSNVGDEVAIGAPFAAVTSTADEVIEITNDVPTEESIVVSNQTSVTKKAELVAKRLGVDLNSLFAIRTVSGPVTEQEVNDFAAQGSPHKESAPAVARKAGVQRVLVIGGGDGATQILDAISRIPELLPMGIVDDNEAIKGATILGVPVLGSVALAKQLFDDNQFDGANLSLGSILPVRNRIFNDLVSLGIPFLNVIDPSVSIGLDVEIGTGNFISAGARIGPSATIGDNNFLSSYVSIEHHNIMGDCCTFGPGVLMSGRVTIGNRVKFGTGVFVEPHHTIGDDALLASGSIVTMDVPAGAVLKAKDTAVLRLRK